MEHRVKTHPEYFRATWNDLKSFEARKNDRNYSVGDMLILEEFKPDKQEYTGSRLVMKITRSGPSG